MVEKFGNTILKKEKLVEQKSDTFVRLIQELPDPNVEEEESFYESVSEKLTPGDVLKLKKIIEYSGK